MAEEFGQSRTEAPTLRRREEARQQGQVAVSAELSSGLLLLAGIAALWFGAEHVGGGLLETLRGTLQEFRPVELRPEDAQTVFASLLNRGLELLGYFLGFMVVVGLGVSALQVGFHVVPELALPNWGKLSPANGWSRLFSGAAGVRGLMAIAKASLVALLALWILRGQGGHIASLGEASLASIVATGWGLAIRMALAIAAALVLVGVADYVFQRWRHEKALFMTRQELKEELKREEGDPHTRARIRKLQREMARKRMLDDVPRATVVITNPTHLAVAIRYERGVMPAPQVVAKGAGFIAERIKELARRHSVPVVERKPVAQALFKAVKVGQDIPTALYYAVAEVLAYVYRLRGAGG